MRKQTIRKLEGLSQWGIAAAVTFCILLAMMSSIAAEDEGVMLIHPVADSHVWSLLPDGNYGHVDMIITYYITVDDTSDIYLKYTIPENLVTGGKYRVENIRLTMTALKGLCGTFATREVLVYTTASNWHESEITWNNKPSLGTHVGTFYTHENLKLYDKLYVPLDDFVFTSGEISFALRIDNDSIPGGDTTSMTFLSKESGQFGTIEFRYIRIYVLPPQLVAIALLVTLAFAGFGLYRKMGEIHDLDSLINGWVFLIYLSILIITAVVLAWSFIG